MKKNTVFSFFNRIKGRSPSLSAGLIISGFLFIYNTGTYPAHAVSIGPIGPGGPGGGGSCVGCVSSDCKSAAPLIPPYHNEPFDPNAVLDANTNIRINPITNKPQQYFGEEYILALDDPGDPTMNKPPKLGWLASFRKYRTWLFTNEDKPYEFPSFFRNYVLRGLAIYTEQMSAVAMQHAMIIGKFLDAKHQLETQRLFQELQFQAHKDYQPSEEICVIGTNLRSISPSEKRAKTVKSDLAKMQRERAFATGGRHAKDTVERWRAFVSTYCDPKNNNWSAPLTGLASACGEKPPNPEKTNIDIDYTRLVEEPRTIEDMSDIFALSKNLYGSKTLTRTLSELSLATKGNPQLYMALRSVEAKRGIAENSFNSIVAMKTSGSSNKLDPLHISPATAKYLGALIKEMGIPEDEIFDYLGDNPSYYSQLEILGKRIFQHTDFYVNLYDTPTNVLRKSAALKAIELMIDREMFDSELRQEMMLSVLLSSEQNEQFRTVNDDMINISRTSKKDTSKPQNAKP